MSDFNETISGKPHLNVFRVPNQFGLLLRSFKQSHFSIKHIMFQSYLKFLANILKR